MKFKFGMESSIELSINKEVVKAPEVATESIMDDIDLNNLSLDCMNSLAGAESCVLELNNLYNMQDYVGTEADSGFLQRVKEASKKAWAAVVRFANKIGNFIMGLFNRNKPEYLLEYKIVNDVTGEVLNEISKDEAEMQNLKEGKPLSEKYVNMVKEKVGAAADKVKAFLSKPEKLGTEAVGIGPDFDLKSDMMTKAPDRVIREVAVFAKAVSENSGKYTYEVHVPVFKNADKIDFKVLGLLSSGAMVSLIPENTNAPDAIAGVSMPIIGFYSVLESALGTNKIDTILKKGLFSKTSLEAFKEGTTSLKEALEVMKSLDTSIFEFTIEKRTLQVDYANEEKGYESTGNGFAFAFLIAHAVRQVSNVLAKTKVEDLEASLTEYLKDATDDATVKELQGEIKELTKITLEVSKIFTNFSKVVVAQSRKLLIAGNKRIR